MVQVARRLFDDLRGEFGRRARGHRPRRNVGQRHDLVVYRLRHLGAAVTDVDAPHAGGRIEQPVTLAVVDVHALAPTEQRALVLAELDEVVPRMNEQVVPLLEFRC